MTMFSSREAIADEAFSDFIQVAYVPGGPIVNVNVDLHYVPNTFLPVFYPYQDRRQYRYNKMAPDGSPDVDSRYLISDTVSALDLQRLHACSFHSPAVVNGHNADGSPVYERNQCFLVNCTQLNGGNFGYFLLLNEFRHGGYFQGLGWGAPLWFEHFSFKLNDPTKPLGTSYALESRTAGGKSANFLIRRPTSNAHVIAQTGAGLADSSQGLIANRSISFVQVWLEDGEPP